MTKGVVHEGVVEHRHYNDLPHKVKLTRGMKGQYGWEISVSGSDTNDMWNKMSGLDSALRKDYGDNQNE